VLEGGKITACADHETLMQTSETYRDIYHSQLKEEEDR
jgi:ABC-type multidrug transport system fused ATPase/permease subunit